MSAVLLMLLLVAPAQGAWMNVEVAKMDRRIMCATAGEIGGRPTLVLCGENGPLYLCRWGGHELNCETRDSGSSYPTSAVIADLRGDGVSRLYVGSSMNKEIIEFTVAESGDWSRLKLGIEFPAAYLSAAYSHLEGKPMLAIETYFLDPIPKEKFAGGMTRHDQRRETQVCTYDSMALECAKLGDSSGKPIYLIGTPESDVVLSNSGYIRLRDRKWTRMGKDPDVRRNIVPSTNKPGTIYVDKAELHYSDDFRAFISSHPIKGGLPDAFTGLQVGAYLLPDQGSFRAIAPVRLRPGIQERLLIAHENDHLYEFTRLRQAWKKTGDIARFPLSPDYLISTDLRGDGRQRVYVVGNGHPTQRDSSALWEIDYALRNITVAALDIVVDDTTAAWRNGAQAILGDLFRAELSKATQLNVIDEEKLEGVRSELKLQEKLCENEECLARLGKPLKAEIVIQSRLTVAGDKLKLWSRVINVADGQTYMQFERVDIAASHVFKAVREMAKAWSLVLRPDAIVRESSR